MRFCISSIFLLTQCLIGLLDWLPFVSVAATSTRSTTDLQIPNFTTPQPYIYRYTRFETLDYWSGDFSKSRKPDCEEDKTATKKPSKTGRRRNEVDSQGINEKSSFTRLKAVDSEIGSQRPDSNETVITDTKLRGYALKEDMETLMMNLKANVSVITLAKTVEVHDIVLVKLSQRKSSKYFRAMDGQQPKYEEEEPQKKIILIVHGLSAMGFRKIPCLNNRESFMKLVKMYAKHLDKFDIFLMPMANPDGISDETLVMWNKNKSPQSTCSGVALDRNFDVHFQKNHGISPCSQHYPGPYAFSEPESRAVADLIHHYNHKIVAFINVHAGSYDERTFKGDAVLHPKGYMATVCDEKYADIDAGIEEAMRNAGFKTFTVSGTCMAKWYGLVSGTSVDYATTIYGIPYGLEFVMQPYAEEYEAEKQSDEIRDNVLTQAWSKVIDVVFNTMYKSIQRADDSDKDTR